MSQKKIINSENLIVTKELNILAEQTASNFDNLAKSISNVSTVAGAAFEVIRLGFNSILSTERFEELRANFKGTEQDIENFKNATGGIVSEENLIKLSNQAADLGESLSQQTILLYLAKGASEKYSISVEDGFVKVNEAINGQSSALNTLRINKDKYNKTLEELVKDAGGEIEAINNETGAHELSIKNLELEEQRRIRIEALIKSSGITIDEATHRN